MKNYIILIITALSFLTSCKGGDPIPPYTYNVNPHYTWGYQEFYGAYYAQFGVVNNTISLSLFTDSLQLTSVDNELKLVGIGQYLYLEDVFVSPSDTILKSGTYTVCNTENADPFMFYAGKNDTIDSEVYPIGAYIYYIEENATKSKIKLISSGSFTVKRYLNGRCTIICDFVTSDSLKLKGQFDSILEFSNQSIKAKSTISPARKRKLFSFF